MKSETTNGNKLLINTLLPKFSYLNKNKEKAYPKARVLL
jgi:hypothetical protein